MHSASTLTVAIMSLILSTTTATAKDDSVTVNVPDQNLRMLILKIKNRYEQKGDEITQADLQSIYFLDASGKKIRDLTGLEHCSNLGEARLANNAIVDVTPLSTCGNLQSLNLSHNQVVDVSPLGKITKLQYLNIAHNQVTSLNGLATLQSLNSLYAANNRIRSIDPVAKLKRLWSLDLSGNQIKDMTPATRLPRLTSLWLADNGIETVTPLGSKTSMLTTDLRRNRIVDVQPLLSESKRANKEQKQYLPFWKLYLAGNPLTGSALDDVSSLAELGVRIDLAKTPDQGNRRDVGKEPLDGIAGKKEPSK